MTAADLSLDTIYGMLSESRRRYVLYYFLDNDHANIENLTLQIAAWEHDVTVDAITKEQKQPVTTSLIHSHLPKLADHGLVEYDSRTGDVVIADGFDEIRAMVTRARATEEEVEVTGSSMESFLYSEPITQSSKTDH
ncbi:DUF7344 domain-containing protein [Natronorubrum sp. FCH18a]|uniref:DUF7344 domain-containing protein n=1 Tax=Natronorubrum sp. FCH18a TaxID=3447018 RepID=UPI003F516851